MLVGGSSVIIKSEACVEVWDEGVAWVRLTLAWYSEKAYYLD